MQIGMIWDECILFGSVVKQYQYEDLCWSCRMQDEGDVVWIRCMCVWSSSGVLSLITSLTIVLVAANVMKNTKMHACPAVISCLNLSIMVPKMICWCMNHDKPRACTGIHMTWTVIDFCE